MTSCCPPTVLLHRRPVHQRQQQPYQGWLDCVLKSVLHIHAQLVGGLRRVLLRKGQGQRRREMGRHHRVKEQRHREQGQHHKERAHQGKERLHRVQVRQEQRHSERAQHHKEQAHQDKERLHREQGRQEQHRREKEGKEQHHKRREQEHRGIRLVGMGKRGKADQGSAHRGSPYPL